MMPDEYGLTTDEEMRDQIDACISMDAKSLNKGVVTPEIILEAVSDYLNAPNSGDGPQHAIDALKRHGYEIVPISEDPWPIKS